jgi:hypothetical protein
LKLLLQKVSLQTVAIVSGLLAGFLIGHLYQQHNQVRITAEAAAAPAAAAAVAERAGSSGTPV